MTSQSSEKENEVLRSYRVWNFTPLIDQSQQKCKFICMSKFNMLCVLRWADFADICVLRWANFANICKYAWICVSVADPTADTDRGKRCFDDKKWNCFLSYFSSVLHVLPACEGRRLPLHYVHHSHICHRSHWPASGPAHLPHVSQWVKYCCISLK